ncbi:MAG TPA: hypothetical protein VNT31_03565 [Nocardioides sp.]|nr:hypothetical protein [Nocardioides sp.]
MSANLYDLLDVDESASADEIRAAWKAAIADLDPTDRRFRAFNDAAGVLLDEDRRTAYDATLAEARAEEGADEPTDAADDTPAVVPVDAGTTTAPDTDPATDTHAATDTATDTDTSGDDDAAARERSGPAGWALGAAGVAAVLSAVLALVLLLQPGGNIFSGESPQERAERVDRIEAASIAAEGAAERLIAPVFSYNYETMAADLERVSDYLTPDLAAKQAKLWPELTEEAVARKQVVEASAQATALTRVSDAGDRATVMVFLRQDSTRDGVDQRPLEMWASLDLVLKAGSEDEWLLDDICVDSGCE